MCVMEVRPGQNTETIAQAMAHNTQTVVSDLKMLRPLLEARNDHPALEQLDLAQAALESAYEVLLTTFADAVKRAIAEGRDVDHSQSHGHERIYRHQDNQVMADAIQAATHAAERYETR